MSGHVCSQLKILIKKKKTKTHTFLHLITQICKIRTPLFGCWSSLYGHLQWQLPTGSGGHTYPFILYKISKGQACSRHSIINIQYLASKIFKLLDLAFKTSYSSSIYFVIYLELGLCCITIPPRPNSSISQIPTIMWVSDQISPLARRLLDNS